MKKNCCQNAIDLHWFAVCPVYSEVQVRGGQPNSNQRFSVIHQQNHLRLLLLCVSIGSFTAGGPLKLTCALALHEQIEGITNGKLTTPSNLIKVIPWHSSTNVLPFLKVTLLGRQKTTATKWLSLEISMLSTLTYPSLRRRFDNGVGAVQTRNVCAAHRGRRYLGAACVVSTAGVISMACDPCVNSWQREIFQQAMISWLPVYCSSLTDKQPNTNYCKICVIYFQIVVTSCFIQSWPTAWSTLAFLSGQSSSIASIKLIPSWVKRYSSPPKGPRQASTKRCESNERIEVQPFAEPQVPSMIPSQKGCASCRISDLKTGTHCAQSFLSRYELIASTVELLRRLPPLMQAAKAWSCRVGLKNSQTYE